MRKLLIGLLMIFPALAGAQITTVPETMVLQLHFWNNHDGVLVEMADMSATDAVCNRNDYYTLKQAPAQPFFRELYSMLLAALTSGKQVGLVTNGCDADGFPIIDQGHIVR